MKAVNMPGLARTLAPEPYRSDTQKIAAQKSIGSGIAVIGQLRIKPCPLTKQPPSNAASKKARAGWHRKERGHPIIAVGA
jgi:hypothetical protein